MSTCIHHQWHHVKDHVSAGSVLRSSPLKEGIVAAAAAVLRSSPLKERRVAADATVASRCSNQHVSEDQATTDDSTVELGQDFEHDLIQQVLVLK